MKRVKFWIRNYFGFSQKETNGFIIILAVMIVSVSAVLAYPYVAGRFGRQQTDNIDQNTLDSLEALIEKQTAALAAQKEKLQKEYIAKKKVRKGKTYTKKPTYTPGEFFAFNPNVATEEEWKRLGFSEKMAQRIQNYVSKGGKFRKKSDLKKIYGFPEKVYDQLVSYIQLPDTYAPSTKKKTRKYTSSNPYFSKSNKKGVISFELNTADTAQLKQISGIGEKLSLRIVKFRDRLGGFVHTDQLKNVYGLKPEVIERLLKHASLKTENIQKINVNTAQIEELKAHPYISYKLAHVIVNYRHQHGKYVVADDLAKVKILDEATLNKLKPYLTF